MAKNPGKGIQIGSNFSGRFRKPLDDRFTFDTLAEMASFPESALYDSIETYNVATKKYYRYFSSNTVDPSTGKWREITEYTPTEIDDLLATKQDILEVDTLPTITGTTDKTYVYLYKGTTDAHYIHGHLYVIGNDNKYHEAYDVYTKSEIETLLSNYYTESEIDTILSNYYTKSEVYNKTEIDTALNNVYTKSETYSKSEIDTTLADYYTKSETYGKSEVYNKTETYSKDEIDTTLADYYDKTETYSKSEVYNKDEIDTTLADYYDKTETYSKDEIDTALDDYYTKSETYSKDEIDTTLADYYDKTETDTKFQEIIQYSTFPAASSTNEGKVYQYTGATAGSWKTGTFYESREVSTGVYEWVALQADSESIQVSSLPTASVSLVNRIYQYVGENVVSGPQKGYFYICIEDPENPGSYIWEVLFMDL